MALLEASPRASEGSARLPVGERQPFPFQRSALPFDDTPRMNPADPVQRQLDAYNARDLERFVAEYSDDVQVFRPPATEPVLSGKPAFAAHYAKHRFALPGLHAELVDRLVCGSTVVDHERITGLQEDVVEAIAVYRVSGAHIRAVWFY